MKLARIIAWTAPPVFMAALGVAATGLRSALPAKPDVNAMIGTLCAYVVMGPPSRIVIPDAARPAPPIAAPAAAPEPADTSVVIAAPPTAVAEAPAAEMPPAQPVDYARLNQDVIVVAETLERFNQKLLRIIAQVRAEQLRAEAQAASAGEPKSPSDPPGPEMAP